MNDAFKQLWDDADVPMIVQEPHELYVAYCLMRGYDSFLEIGSCYGFSLYVLGHALNPGGRIVSVDLGEEKSVPHLEKNVEKLNNRGYDASLIKGHSQEVDVEGEFDVVFIDGDHNYAAVKADVEKYKPLCKSLLLLHDIRMDGPGRVLTEIGGGLRINCDHPIASAPQTGFGAQFYDGAPVKRAKSDNCGVGAVIT